MKNQLIDDNRSPQPPYFSQQIWSRRIWVVCPEILRNWNFLHNGKNFGRNLFYLLRNYFVSKSSPFFFSTARVLEERIKDLLKKYKKWRNIKHKISVKGFPCYLKRHWEQNYAPKVFQLNPYLKLPSVPCNFTGVKKSIWKTRGYLERRIKDVGPTKSN